MDEILPAPFCLPTVIYIVTLFGVVWLGAWLVNIFVLIVQPLAVRMFIEITRLDPSGGFSSVGGTMGRPYCVVPVGADLTLLDLLLPVVGGDLLLQLPALLLQLGARHLGVAVSDDLASYDEYSCSRLATFETSRPSLRSHAWPTDSVLHYL